MLNFFNIFAEQIKQINMAEVALIMGPSGSGKSTSIRNLNPEETFIINTLGKTLPFKGSSKSYTVWDKERNPKGNMIKNSNSSVVVKWLEHIDKNVPTIKNIIIEDNTHLSSMEYIRRIKENGWEKFNDIASNMVGIIDKAKSLRDDIIVYILHHVKEEGDGILEDKTTKAMTLGKLVEEKMSSYESFFTIVLLAQKKKTESGIEYGFLTNDANSTAKSPLGMFEETFIANDLSIVKEAIRCFYNDEDC